MVLRSPPAATITLWHQLTLPVMLICCIVVAIACFPPDQGHSLDEIYRFNGSPRVLVSRIIDDQLSALLVASGCRLKLLLGAAVREIDHVQKPVVASLFPAGKGGTACFDVATVFKQDQVINSTTILLLSFLLGLLFAPVHRLP